MDKLGEVMQCLLDTREGLSAVPQPIQGAAILEQTSKKGLHLQPHGALQGVRSEVETPDEKKRIGRLKWSLAKRSL